MRPKWAGRAVTEMVRLVRGGFQEGCGIELSRSSRRLERRRPSGLLTRGHGRALGAPCRVPYLRLSWGPVGNGDEGDRTRDLMRLRRLLTLWYQ